MSPKLRFLLSLAIAGVLLALLFVWGDLDRETLSETWRLLSLEVYLAATGLHLALYFLRGLRFRLLLPPEERPGLVPVLGVSAAHNLAAFVLPAKTGEASLILYLKKVCGVSGVSGLAALLVSRILDLAVLSGSVGLACLLAQPLEGAESMTWLRPLGGALLAGSILFFVLATRGDRLVAVYRALAKLTRFERTGLGVRLGDRAQEAGEALRGAGTRWISSALVSLPMWVCAYLFYAVLARGFGLPESITLAEAGFGSGLAMVANLLPVNGLAGFGTQEAGWVVGFHLLGVPRDLAFSTGLSAHVVQLFNIAIFGVIGHVVMGLFSKSAADQRP